MGREGGRIKVQGGSSKAPSRFAFYFFFFLNLCLQARPRPLTRLRPQLGSSNGSCQRCCRPGRQALNTGGFGGYSGDALFQKDRLGPLLHTLIYWVNQVPPYQLITNDVYIAYCIVTLPHLVVGVTIGELPR